MDTMRVLGIFSAVAGLFAGGAALLIAILTAAGPMRVDVGLPLGTVLAANSAGLYVGGIILLCRYPSGRE